MKGCTHSNALERVGQISFWHIEPSRRTSKSMALIYQLETARAQLRHRVMLQRRGTAKRKKLETQLKVLTERCLRLTTGVAR